jgi:uncharacterized membrane protein YjgN (DUF898 family)
LGSSKLHFEFTGTGPEYFKIWIVNLLLTLVTLGLYYPWAKTRRLQYFYSSTQLDGDPLEYDGSAIAMARGHALLAILAGVFCAASVYAKGLALLFLLVLVTLLPALLHASQHYRLRHTTWRGLRFGFKGTQAQAYGAILPLIGAVGGILALALVTPWGKPIPTWLAYCALVMAIACLGLAPWLAWNLKQYQHKHFTLGTLKSRFKATAQDYYRLFLQIYLFTVILLSIATSLALDWLGATAFTPVSQPTINWACCSHAAIIYFAVVTLILWLLIRPFATSRFQNMVWTQTGNSALRFVSLLRYRLLVWQGLKNSLFMVVTLGLYWPFAAVAMARLRIESIRVKTQVDPNVLICTASPLTGKAAIAQDNTLFGLEIGL